MVDVGQLWVRLGLDSAQFRAALADAKTGLVGWKNETNESSKSMLGWGAAIGATVAPIVAVGYALANVTAKAAQFGKGITDNARDLGLSTEQFQRWAHVAVSTGSSAGEITSAIRMLTIRLRDAADPTSEISRLMKALGVSVYDAGGKLRDTSSVLLDLLPALNALPEGMDRNQASMVMFGKNISNIADLTSLTRDEIQKLMSQAPVFSDEKISAMDDYAIKTAELNEKIEYLTIDIGTELIPVMEDVLSLVEDSAWATSPMLDFIGKASFGIDSLITGMRLLWLEGKRGLGASGGGPEAQLEYDKLWEKYIERGVSAEERMAGTPGKSRYTSNELLAKITAGETLSRTERNWAKQYDPTLYNSIPENKKSLNIEPKPGESEEITASEILQKQNRLAVLKWDVNDAETEYNKLLKLSDKTQVDYNENVDRARLKMEALKLEAAGLTDELQKAGAAVSGISGGQTYNQQFASELQFGGVGPDTAGFSDLANLTPDQLKKMAAGDFSLTGGSKAVAEKADEYQKRMIAGGASATPDTTKKTTKKTPLTPAEQAADDTQTITTETGRQADAYTTLTERIVAEWTKQEAAGITHYTALSEMARTEMQKLMDDWYATAEYITGTIAYNQTITVTDGVQAAEPIAFAGTAAPQLTTIDLSGIKLLGGGTDGGSSGGQQSNDRQQGASGTGGSSGAATQVVVNVNNPQGLSTPASIQQASKALASALQRGSAT